MVSIKCVLWSQSNDWDRGSTKQVQDSAYRRSSHRRKGTTGHIIDMVLGLRWFFCQILKYGFLKIFRYTKLYKYLQWAEYGESQRVYLTPYCYKKYPRRRLNGYVVNIYISEHKSCNKCGIKLMTTSKAPSHCCPSGNKHSVDIYYFLFSNIITSGNYYFV